jgi:hypothetical protein
LSSSTYYRIYIFTEYNAIKWNNSKRNLIYLLLRFFSLDDIIDTIDDVTIGYEGNFPITELDLLKGHVPKAVHFHVERFNINDLPKEDEQIGQWLQERWNEKENRLKE